MSLTNLIQLVLPMLLAMQTPSLSHCQTSQIPGNIDICFSFVLLLIQRVLVITAFGDTLVMRGRY